MSEKKAALKQNPHRLERLDEKTLEAAIGREVKTFRQMQGLTVADLSDSTGISVGMLSKIENGMTSPSLTTLQTLSAALGVQISSFFRQFEKTRQAVLVKAGEGLEIERRGSRSGHQYKLLGHLGGNSTGVVVEPYMITLTSESDVFPTFQHDGLEFLYVLEGEVEYRHGTTSYHLCPGDSLYFDANAPHGPDKLLKLPIRFLSIISYAQKD